VFQKFLNLLFDILLRLVLYQNKSDTVYSSYQIRLTSHSAMQAITK